MTSLQALGLYIGWAIVRAVARDLKSVYGWAHGA